MDLDQLLDAAAPPVTAQTPTLAREVEALALACETEQRTTRHRLRIGVVAAATTAVLAVGATSAATGLVPTPGWLPWSTSSGHACEMSFDVVSAADGNGEPITHPFTRAEAEQAMAAARGFLAAYDYDALDRDRAVEQWQRAEARTRAAQPADERQPVLTGDDLEITAVGRVVARDLVDDLRARGIDDHLVVFTQGWRCDG